MQILPMAKKLEPAPQQKYQEGEIIELGDLDLELPGEVCCGGPPAPKSNPFERPGYVLKNYVRAFIKSGKSDIALVKTQLGITDHLGTLLTRLGIIRDNYRVAPGLYGVGVPGKDSPVLVTANYKLTFDTLRKQLGGLNCWILVLDTCGINVWCAAGKNTFSTEELIERIYITELASKVDHNTIILPQLGAVGVAAHKVKLQSGFRVVYGPVSAQDIPAFLNNDLTATDEMRRVTFTLKERLVLVPVEFYLFSKKIWWLFPLLFLFSGIGPEIFSLETAATRGMLCSVAVILGGLLGGVIMPILLPWLPGRRFSVKGAILALLVVLTGNFLLAGVNIFEKISLGLIVVGISSFLAMNFTGSTPYTSPSGVEKEMKLGIPFQAMAIFTGGVFWLISPFF